MTQMLQDNQARTLNNYNNYVKGSTWKGGQYVCIDEKMKKKDETIRIGHF